MVKVQRSSADSEAVEQGSTDLRLAEVIAAMSYALDITDGQPLGHAVRSCLIGMRLAEEIGLDVEARAALFYGLLLKDAGCSSNAAKIASLYGADDHAAKENVRLVNHSRIGEALLYIVRNAGGVRGLVRVLAAGKKTANEMTRIRCERGADIARTLELPEAAAEAIYGLDEHWDGKGHPDHRAGEAIPLLARILCLSQTVEVFLSRVGLDGALEVARERSGTWFDPALVEALERFAGDRAFWDGLRADDVDAQVARFEPGHVLTADEERLDRVAEAFAGIIDAKSPYTYRHSAGVAEIAVAIASELGFDDAELRDLRRAGLLHDIGKLSVSNRILDKPGRLDDDEFALVRRHPEHTLSVLERVPAFAAIADVAANHHERLDGTGYPRGLAADELTLPMRVLAVADVFEALTADRPYRGPLPTEEALAIIRADAGTKLCPTACSALEAWCGGASRAARAA